MRFGNTMRLNSLSVKVLIAYVAGAAFSIGLFVLLTFATVTLQGDTLAAADAADRAEDLAGMLRFDDRGVPVGFDDSEGDLASWLYDSLKGEMAYRVLDAAGTVVLSSAAGDGAWPTAELGRPPRRGRFEFERAGVAMLGATASVEHEGRAWFLQYAVSVRFMDLMYRGFALRFAGEGIFLFSLVLLFVFGACAYATLRYTLRPLRRISESAAAISPRSLHARLQADAAPAEIVPLVESFNRVLERLEQGYRTQQEFLATAAHELKTPLALMRTQIELIDGGNDRSPLLNDVEHMTRQVQQLLLLAEASEVGNYSFTAVDVQDVAKETANYLRRMADAADVRLVTSGSVPGPQWRADRGALFTLLKNMLENAIQHAPRGTEVRVEVGAAAISVRDWGPGVEQDELSQMFSRFWRGAHRRDHGAGLGLAICREIALAHGWMLSAHREDPGLRLCLRHTRSENRS